ncbi:unnamed protein product [Cyprideis torosa]|uniref:peptidylprolyl isomerase n=1 Tax=Cyprideis torosa TaxID=163714 RepID=A0A7R8WA30_9CRUS|nr:unnamed protein product [Cyprideis torosa]CAG0885040.1 unnamed protein product [Cyprideis torosa]
MPEEGKPYTPGNEAVDLSEAKDRSILKEVLHKGQGTSQPFKGANVTVHYVGYLASDGSKFDGSRDRGEPFTFKLGEGHVIKAWDVGVASMVPGEVAIFTCAASAAYGEQGMPPKIPGGATLVFEVELLDFEREDLSEEKDGGILRELITAGTGYAEPTEGAALKVHLVGSCGGNQFEDRTVEFELGAGEDFDIPLGIEIALRRFKKGEKSKLTLSPKNAFGKAGRDSVVGPDAVVEYEVELLSMTKRQEVWQMDLPEKFAEARNQKEKGGKLFGEGKYERAVAAYKRSVECLDTEAESTLDEEQQKERKALLLAGRLNLSLVYLKKHEPRLALEQAEKALQFDPNSVKGLFRRGQANLDLKAPDLARPDFKRVTELDPKNSIALQRLSLCNTLLKKQLEQDKKVFGNMFDRFAAADKKREERQKAQQKKEEKEIMTNVGEWGKQKEAVPASGDAPTATANGGGQENA